MFSFVVRFLIIFIASIVQIALFYSGAHIFQMPNILLALALAWTLIGGYSVMLPWLILLGFIVDLLLFQRVGASIMLFVVLGYIASLLSRRFLVGHRVWGGLALLGFVFIATTLYFLGQVVMATLGSHENTLVFLWRVFSWREFVWTYVGNVLLFWMCYWGLGKIEHFLSYYRQQVQPKNYIS